MREMCDQFSFMVSLINNKSDNFLDGLSPVIELSEELSEGCDDGSLAVPATDLLRQKHGRSLTAVLQGCSDEVRVNSNAGMRDARGPPRSIIISPYSSSATMMNETLYPNVARTIYNSGNIAIAAAAVCIDRGWKRVAVLHDSSDWATSTFLEFEKKLTSFDSTTELLVAQADRTFDRSDCLDDVRDAQNRTIAQQLLARLEAAGSRIVMVLTHPQCYRRILAETYRSKKLFGPGYAWLVRALRRLENNGLAAPAR